MHPEEQSSHVVSRKRKNPSDQLEHDGRAIKHRASQACQSCRTRKVRCDVLTNASRCTNCRLDQLDCVVLASRRGQSKREHNKPKESHASQKKQSRPSRSANAANAVQESDPAETTTFDTWAATDGSVGSVPACVTFDDETSSPHEDNDSNNVSGQHPSAAGDTGINLSPSTPYVGLLTPDTNNFQPQQGAAEKPPFPAFITPLSSSVAREDLEYLIRKGALAVPEPDLQIEILRAYLFSIHPFMPILDYRAFVHAVLSNRQDDRISLLLFQAVMFAGLHSLPPPVIHRLGFESAKQAREVFYNRVRLLYEFNVEPDTAATLQSLLLMSSWYSQWDARRDTWYWTGQAYDVARKMGLHREPTARFASENTRRFRRRLWWSLYIRDRMIALGTRRPMRIYDYDFDVTMLTLEDFDLASFDEYYQGQPLVPSAKENEATAVMCIQLAKLCIHIGRVVSSQYTTQARDIPSTVMVVSRRDERRAEELENCDRELSTWFEESCSTGNATATVTTPTIGLHSCSEVHSAVLNMTYQTTINVLHRTQALQPSPHTPDDRMAQTSSRSNVKRSARRLTKLLQSMLRRDQLRFVGLIGVTAIIAAYLSHLLDITSAADDEDDLCDASKFRLCQSLEILHVFRYTYASADAALSFLASVSQKAGIPVPVQVAGPTTGWPSALPAPTGRHIAASGENNSSIAQGNLQPVSPFPIVTPLLSNRQQQQQQSLLLDRAGKISSVNNGTIFSNNSAVTASGSTTQSSNPEHGNLHVVDTTSVGMLNLNAQWSSLFSWDNGIASGLENSMDPDPMSFNHDFYIDAFGFTDSRIPGT